MIHTAVSGWSHNIPGFRDFMKQACPPSPEQRGGVLEPLPISAYVVAGMLVA